MANEPVVKLRKKEYSSEADNQAGIITFDDESKGIYVGGERYGGEMNVQPDWNQTISTASDYIKNKPEIPDTIGSLTDVTISTVEDGQILRYDQASGRWANGNSTSVTIRTWSNTQA